MRLPDLDGLMGYRGRRQWFAGMVREVDPPGIGVPGVRVDLDAPPVNGADDCYATHAELRGANCPAGDPCGLPGCPCMPAGTRGTGDDR